MMIILMGWRSRYPNRVELKRIQFNDIDELEPWFRHAVAVVEAADTSAADGRKFVKNVGHKSGEQGGLYIVEENFVKRMKKTYTPEDDIT